MRNLIISLVRRTPSDVTDEVKPSHSNFTKLPIQLLVKEDFSAVVGGPQVENDPEIH
jgi:hypothetical protein